MKTPDFIFTHPSPPNLSHLSLHLIPSFIFIDHILCLFTAGKISDVIGGSLSITLTFTPRKRKRRMIDDAMNIHI